VKRSSPTSALEKVEAILANPAIYALAEAIPPPASSAGRPRSYPAYMLLVYDCLLSVYRSARQVEAELSHPLIWRHMRRIVKRRFPKEPSMHLSAAPMRRHHYIYGRNRYLTDPGGLSELSRIHREIACAQAREMGLLLDDGPGSFTHPDLSRMLYADGKVVTPLYKAHPGATRVDKRTGEVVPARFEPDAGLHFEGTGETAWGCKFVLVAARLEEEQARIILDLEAVVKPGREAAIAMECFTRLAPLVPGAQGVIYDTALRGVHHQTLLRELGLLPVNRVTAAQKGAKNPRRVKGRRVEKSVHVEVKDILIDGVTTRISLYARGGAIGLAEPDETGDMIFSPLRRTRTRRTQDKNRLFRWYNDYELPASLGGSQITVRLHANEHDKARGLNRTENVRPIPQGDPDFAHLYSRRNDAESINRALEDTLYLGRAHSVGRRRQLVEVLGYALTMNSLALNRHRRKRSQEAA
jgi:hypothetical protein